MALSARKPTPKNTALAESQEKKKRVNFDVPLYKHGKFKARCAVDDTDMREVLEALIDGYLENRFTIERKKRK